MPTVPATTKCAYLGCKAHRSKLNSYCNEHGGIDYTERADDGPYHSKAWQTMRALQLSKQPLCQSCFSRGLIHNANHVDHLFPWRRLGGQAFRHNVFQSLCTECHSHKTALERKGEIHHYTSDGTVVYTLGDYGYVMHNAQGID
jgi:5-methylcytosine-specific restriction endonuclease McrA